MVSKRPQKFCINAMNITLDTSWFHRASQFLGQVVNSASPINHIGSEPPVIINHHDSRWYPDIPIFNCWTPREWWLSLPKEPWPLEQWRAVEPRHSFSRSGSIPSSAAKHWESHPTGEWTNPPARSSAFKSDMCLPVPWEIRLKITQNVAIGKSSKDPVENFTQKPDWGAGQDPAFLVHLSVQPACGSRQPDPPCWKSWGKKWSMG